MAIDPSRYVENEPYIPPYECFNCTDPKVLARDARPMARGDWYLELQCPECDAKRSGTFSSSEKSALDEVESYGRLIIRSGLKKYMREDLEAFAGEVEVIVEAIETDLIEPIDF